MPDEVNALDAIHQQVSALRAPGGMVSWTERERDLIQRGLHSLTGGSSAQERSATASALTQSEPGSMEFGFLLHRFGDTYAHSVRGAESQVVYSTGMGHALHGHTPDQIHMRPDLYGTYVRDLFGTLSHVATSHGLAPRLSREQVDRFAQEVASIRVMRTERIRDPDLPRVYEDIQVLDVEATERAQIQRIRELSEQLMPRSEFQESTIGPPTAEQASQPPVGRMEAYAPESEDTMSWWEYRRNHSSFVAGREWSQVADAVESAAGRVGQNPRSIFPLRPQ